MTCTCIKCLCHIIMHCIIMLLRILHHSGELGQLMGTACRRMHSQAPQNSRKKAACSLSRKWYNSCSAEMYS